MSFLKSHAACNAKLAYAIKKTATLPIGVLVVSLFATHAMAQNNVSSEVSDHTFYTAANMLAYTELELSGEPLAESLGLDLDMLDPNFLDEPTQFDYVAGIESYEYSEEAMYALNYQSQLGPHLVNGPQNINRGGNLKSLQKRMDSLAKSVGFPSTNIAKNIYPISLPYRSASPEFNGQVDIHIIATEEIEVANNQGDVVTATAQIPAYQHDYKTLAWNKKQRELVIEPAAIGGILLKEVMWSQDFLEGMHVIKSDEEVEANSSKMDRDGKLALGVSSADGMNGVILTELSVDKMLYLQDQLAFDGKSLGANITPQYNANKNPIWFPHAIKVTEKKQNGVNAIGQLKVQNSDSTLRDSWMLLWPLSEYFAYSDQRIANTGQNPAFKAVFDGQPFKASPKVNADINANNNIASQDAFSLASNLSNMMFKNIDALHLNKQANTLVDTYSTSGKKSQHVTTYDAAYSIVALSIFQRAQDALPVGYASASGGEVNLKTAQGKRALTLIKSQANFIVNNLITKNGLVSDGALLAQSGSISKLDKGQSLDAQFASIRGLSAAFIATGQTHFRDAARNLYVSIEQHYFSKDLGTWAINGQGEYSPWTAAAVVSALRETMLHLKNNESENTPELELAALVNRHATWFRTVINGPTINQGLQLSEALADTGEYFLKGQKNNDSDSDGVAKINRAGGKFGRANVMAAKVVVSKKI
ncbi:MAG: hypothetical protein V7785_01055 [Bermanella sp.]